MGLVLVMGLMAVAGVWGDDIPSSRLTQPNKVDDVLAATDLMQAFVVFRHGDRTPDEEELNYYPSEEKINKNVFFPYGTKALTNKGKQRAFAVGKYLRKRYDGLVSRLYLPDEIAVRTTRYARTKMTALTALAGLYPPPPAQKWNPLLDWQPIPYDTLPFEIDDLQYWYNCPRYIKLRNEVYSEPEIVEWLKPYYGLIMYLREQSGKNITTPEDVFFLDNLFQTLKNVGINPPDWAAEVMPQIKDVTKIEYATEFYTTEMIRLASGVLMGDILNATRYFMAGETEQPKLRLYSAHENNVAGLMAAARVFKSHQPNYGSTFSLELRRDRLDGKYKIAAVYAREAGGPEVILPVAGCGGQPLCDYDMFAILVQDYMLSQEEFEKQCHNVS